jgi:exodeoxyribonuclease V gamma subunit
MFAKDHTLRPRDVVVMMPQAGKYLPYIEAVFSGSAEYLPYHITDLSMVEESPLLNSIDVLLALPKSRLTLSEVLSIIEVPAVQRQFNLDRKSYEQLKALLVKAGARWGLDAEHRQQQGLPAYSEFSWEFAINRLLSGFSMAEQDENADAFIVEMASDALAISPLDEIEGGSAELLNSFMRFWKTLTHYRGELQYEKTALQWSDCIANLLESFFAVDDDEEELRALREIRKLLQVLRQTGIEEWHIDKIALDVVRDFLKTALKDTSHRSHQWREGVKFCSLMPMRGVPFRVIYIMGMNQGDYPGRVEKKSFDLMRHHHRTGDRSRSVDDRWLFLEALLSARDVFHVSYIGHDQRKNDVRQPSVLVAELIDYLRDGYDAPINQYITEHPLQPFSKQYFLAEKNKPNTRLVSYNQQAFAIASASSNVKNTSEYIWPISETAKQIIEVSIDDFIGFFTDPAKWFLNNKYKTYVSIKDNGISDEELFEMNALNAWQAREAIKKQSINSDASISSLVDKLEVTWQAQARWPLGSAGDSFKNKLKGTIDHAWLDAAKLKIAPRQVFVNELVKSHFGSLHISGNVMVYDDSVIEHSASKRKEKTELQFYLRALFSALTDSSIKQAQAFFYKDKSVAEITLQLEGDFHRALLQQLVEVYLQYRDYGLPFLPELSKKISDAQQGSSAQALIDNAWYGSQYILGVQSDITQRAYYINKERLESPQFTQVSIHVWQAISSWLSHVEVVKEKG